MSRLLIDVHGGGVPHRGGPFGDVSHGRHEGAHVGIAGQTFDHLPERAHAPGLFQQSGKHGGYAPAVFRPYRRAQGLQSDVVASALVAERHAPSADRVPLVRLDQKGVGSRACLSRDAVFHAR